ncbi:2-amino-3,7-dideoxy-D-threo-hept-6-ulosonate synthase [Gordonia sp. NB41Y]|uniref:2-amino-3,7-dideoxy-D-threo-hept-6-ulosonate synthase n=1 Tax=Gordonia sp. NB41Y TaxID=875808 RepID=UPI0002BDFEDF|nr:2-amino-3,7-dideoxy-D-threo-hept-6-ulosonate synthase [Gordonia sp. NB41Y]EMP12436.1 transaldolase [Gordonia sp. NB41Y]WLP90945.1 2-amino-3,7-dideoxy-D-threo-hept-6-ulosonate synthase [Gordonia sp. NB41Y]
MSNIPDGHRRPPAYGGKAIRLSRITDPATRRAQIVPLDHSVTIGPLGPRNHTENIVRMLSRTACDAVVLHRGRVAQIAPEAFTGMGLIVHLSASTSLALDSDAKVIVGGVDAALRSGADAVSIHVNVGSETETQQLTDLAAVSRECQVLGVPLLAMMYARGPRQAPRPDAATVAHLAAIATDLGADMVKLDYTGSPESMERVVDTTPLPIYVAGGATRSDDDAIAFGAEVLQGGVAGLSFGRNIFDADDPARVVNTLADLVHRRVVPTDILPALESA